MKKKIKRAFSTFMVAVMILAASPLSGFIGINLTAYFDTTVKAKAADSRVEAAINWAIAIANDNSHGYSQANRNGPDYDCSSFVSTAFKTGGFAVSGSLHTGNMLNAFLSVGFTKYNKGSVTLQRGDILLRPKTASRGGHTELYIGNNQCVAAHSNKDGKTGDSSGSEIDVRSKNYCTFCKNSDYIYILRYEGPNDYGNYTYSFNFNANGGTLGSVGSFSTQFGSDFQILNTTCTRSGYTWAGWHVKRNNDNKWFVAGQGWCTDSQISSNGYIKKVYSNYQTCKLDDSWTSGISGNCSYTFYAVWVQQRNTQLLIFMSPYGRDYDHITAFNNTTNSGFAQEKIYAWYILYDTNTGKLLNTYADWDYSVLLEIYDPNGELVYDYNYTDSSDANWIGITPQMSGQYTAKATFTRGSTVVGVNTAYTVSYDAEVLSYFDSISLNLNGTNSVSDKIFITGFYPGKYGVRYQFANGDIASAAWSGEWDGDSTSLTITGKKVGSTNVTISVYENYTGNKNIVASTTIPVTVTANTYSVKYNANGGSGSMSNSSHTYSVAKNLTTNAFTKTGYTFLGWSTSSSATTATYTDGQSVTNLTSTNGATINLYAVWKANTYSVKYNANGGSGSMSNSSHTYSVSKNLTTNAFTKTGYIFLGWSTSSSATTATYTDGQSVTNLTSTNGATVNLYAVWKADDTALSVNSSNNATISTGGEIKYYTFTPSESGTYVIYSTGSDDTKVYLYDSSGSEITNNDDGGDNTNFRLSYSLTAGTKYRFGVKYYNSSKTGTILFKFGKVYTITYNANGGSSVPSSQTKDYGTALTLSSITPTRVGYTFLGWSTSSTATSATYQPSGSFTTNANTTLYAVWKANTYTVQYNANGGSGTMSNSSHTYDVSKTLTSNAFTRSGYTFLGWSTSSTATTVTYTNGQLVKNLTSTNGATVTLYAVWDGSSNPTCAIASYSNGASSGSICFKVTDDNGVAGYYWGTDSLYYNNTFTESSSKWVNLSIHPEETYYFTAKDINGNISNTIPVVYYRIVTYRYGNSGFVNYYMSGSNYRLTTSEREGYTFLGWSTSRNAESASYEADETFVATEDKTYYGVWKANTYTIQYNANGGSGTMSNSSHTYDVSKALTSNAFTRSGYSFLGWSKDSSATTATYTNSQSVKNLTSVNGDTVTLYAVWHKHSYTSKVTTAATCTTAGVRTYTCSKCSHSYTESIATKGHTWTGATCTSPQTCSVCNATSGTAAGHSYTSKVTTAATCTAAGVRTYTCSKCSHSYTETIAKLGHNYSSSYTVDTPATCTTAGSKSQHCTRCTAKQNVTSIPATGHSYTSKVTKEPTCTATGVRTYTCLKCSHSYTETIAKLGHNYSSSYTIDTPAICTTAGSKSQHCSRCTSKQNVTAIPATGHNYVNGACSTCGKTNVTTSAAITVSSVSATAGSQVRVAISLKNNPGITSMLLRVNYDESKLQLVSVEDGGNLGTAFHSNAMNSPFTLSWANDTATTNYTYNGDIVIFTFDVKDGAALGATPITVTYDYDNYDIIDKDMNPVEFNVANGSVNIIDVLIGDVNNDGKVNQLDRVVLTRYLANWTEYPEGSINTVAADVNCDGKVNTLDRVILTRYIANWTGYESLPYNN